jgi:hypothetical protein
MTTLNSAAGWFSLVTTLLGVAAGLTVPLVFHVSHWLTPIIIAGTVLVAMQEGSYREWSDANDRAKEADRSRADAEAALKVEQTKPRGGNGWVVTGANNKFIDSSPYMFQPGGDMTGDIKFFQRRSPATFPSDRRTGQTQHPAHGRNQPAGRDQDDGQNGAQQQNGS